MPIHKPFQQKKGGSKVRTYKDMKKRPSIAIESPYESEKKFNRAKLNLNYEGTKVNPSKMVMLLHHH